MRTAAQWGKISPLCSRGTNASKESIRGTDIWSPENHGTGYTMEALLGPKLVSATGETIDTSCLAAKKTVSLYFSAHWCGPCRGFTPELAKAYSEFMAGAGESPETEVVFVSWDQDDDSFGEYHKEMPFPAVPFKDNQERCRKLGEQFGVRGIPCLVTLNSAGEVVHKDGRTLVAKHGAAAFPLSTQRVDELKQITVAKAEAALRNLCDGTISFPIKAPGGAEVSFKDLLGAFEHCGLLFGDGDSSDDTYKQVASIVEKVNADAKRQVLIYLPWRLWDGGDHAPFADQFHSVPDVSGDLRTALEDVAGGPNCFGLLQVKLGSGLCGMDGKCEPEGVPVVVANDEGFRRITKGGVPAYPWSDAKMDECAAAEKARMEKLKARQTNLEFLKGEAGEDTMLVRSKGEKPSVSANLASLGDDGVVGLYFRCGTDAHFLPLASTLSSTHARTHTPTHARTHAHARTHTHTLSLPLSRSLSLSLTRTRTHTHSAHWCPPCRRFTPKLVECYEKLKAAGKKFEVVFVSSDKVKEGFDEYFASMTTSAGDQLMALDFDERQLKNDLSTLFEVSGIPTLVLLKANGEVITTEGTDVLDADYFPWDKESRDRYAAEREAKAAAAAKAAVDKEKEDAAAQRAAGDVVVERLQGPPVDFTHDVAAKTLKFDTFGTFGAPEALAESGVLYYEVTVLEGSEGIPQIGFSLKDGMERTTIVYAMAAGTRRRRGRWTARGV